MTGKPCPPWDSTVKNASCSTARVVPVAPGIVLHRDRDGHRGGFAPPVDQSFQIVQHLLNLLGDIVQNVAITSLFCHDGYLSCGSAGKTKKPLSNIGDRGFALTLWT